MIHTHWHAVIQFEAVRVQRFCFVVDDLPAEPARRLTLSAQRAEALAFTLVAIRLVRCAARRAAARAPTRFDDDVFVSGHQMSLVA